MTLRASLLVPLIAAALSMSGAEKTAFISGVWQGDANYDADGKFSDCLMTAQAESGVLIGFVRHRDTDPNGYLNIIAEPAVNPNRISVVSVMVH